MSVGMCIMKFCITQVDVKTTALAMAITDSELSDEEASILESGGFSVSRATTPQLTDLSEGKETYVSVSRVFFTHAQVPVASK